MKVLKFKKLTLTNFLSVGNTPLEFNFQNGLNLITGYNKDNPEEKNGIGKSSICDGLFFALFNEPIKNLKMGQIVNDKNNKKCIVELEFAIIKDGKTSDYKIIRGIKPSKCMFEVNGKEDATLSSIPMTNKAIATAIGVSKELFKQSIVMSVGKSLSFFDQSKIDKRKFIEGIFDLEIFSEMLLESRSNFNDTKTEKEHVNSSLENERNRLEQYTEKDATFEKNKAEYILLLKQQIDSDISKIKKLKSTLKDEESPDILTEDRGVIKGRLKKVDDLSLKVEIALSNINTKINELKSIINNSSDICQTCNRPYEDAESINAVKRKHKDTINTLVGNRVEISDKKTKIKAKKDEIEIEQNDTRLKLASINSTIDGNKIINSHISTLNVACTSNNGKISTKQDEVSNVSDLIADTEREISILEVKYKEALKNNKIFDICKFILSEEGVKSVIINQLKDLLNFKLNEYLDKLGSPVTCNFDEYFTETIYNGNGVEKAYDSFSGGESKRIDLAILLTFQDILKDQSGIDIRLGFYDEILDSSIDETGRKKVLRILKDKSEKTAIYIISHRGKMSDLIDNEIVLEKYNDFTFLKEIN